MIVSSNDLEIELCLSFDERVKWFNKELEIQPKSKHPEMRENLDKVSLNK